MYLWVYFVEPFIVVPLRTYAPYGSTESEQLITESYKVVLLLGIIHTEERPSMAPYSAPLVVSCQLSCTLQQVNDTHYSLPSSVIDRHC